MTSSGLSGVAVPVTSRTLLAQIMASPYAPPMRIGCAAAAILIATAACGASSAAHSTVTTAGSGHCGPTHARTLAADRSARIYALSNRVYGCVYRSFLLGNLRPRLGEAR